LLDELVRRFAAYLFIARAAHTSFLFFSGATKAIHARTCRPVLLVNDAVVPASRRRKQKRGCGGTWYKQVNPNGFRTAPLSGWDTTIRIR
jgi:hypothetical protein